MNKIRKPKATHTRTISPWLGLFGIFGFAGFLGFLPQLLHITDILPVPVFFFFFGFFGFFGFYFEGKMSNTLMDERYVLDRYRAEAVANKTALVIIIGMTGVVCALTGKGIVSAYGAVGVLIASIGFAGGLSIFLSQYLLYKYENGAD